jgi:hypothetical protein
VKRARIDTPYPSRSATAKALGVTKKRMRQLAALVELLLRENGKGARPSGNARKTKTTRGYSVTAKRPVRPASAHAR